MIPPRLALLAAMAIVWWLALAAWPDLPARIPRHFDAGGRPDAWTDTGVVSWFGVPALATLLGAVFGVVLPAWIRRLAERRPQWVNVVGGRARFQALPAAARQRVVAAMTPWLVWLATLLQALFAALVRGSADVATGGAERMPTAPLVAALVGLGGLVVGMVAAQVRALDRETARC